MTPEELREKVAQAVRDEYRRPLATWNSVADAALSVVREAMREPSEEMVRAYRAAMAPDRIQGFQYGGVLVIRDVWREPKEQELWRGPADPVEPGKLFSVGPLHDAFMERCADEKVRLGARAMLAASPLAEPRS